MSSFSNFLLIISLLICFSFIESKKHHQRELKCSLCEVIVDEVESGIARTSVQHSVQSRFRIEEKKYIPYARTEFRIMEILDEEIPNHLNNYGIVKGSSWRVAKQQPTPVIETPPTPTPTPATTNDATTTETVSTNTPIETPPVPSETVSATTPNPNPEKIESVPVVASSGPEVEVTIANSKKLKLLYEELLFGNTDEITLLFHRETPDVKKKMCIDLIKVCPQNYKFTNKPIQTLTPLPASEREPEILTVPEQQPPSKVEL